MGMSTGGRDGLASEINVTPLVDVMLVLLVIFMITAPMLESAVDLDLPEGMAPEVIEDPEGRLTLRVGKNRELELGGTPVKWTELGMKLSSNARVQKERELYIEADKNLPYGVVVRAMIIAKESGATKVFLKTDPSEHAEPLEAWDSAAPQPAPAQP